MTIEIEEVGLREGLQSNQKLLSLEEKKAVIDQLIDAPAGRKTLSEIDLHVPLLELPGIFGTTLDTIPCNIPYLHADPIKAEYWRQRLTGKKRGEELHE